MTYQTEKVHCIPFLSWHIDKYKDVLAGNYHPDGPIYKSQLSSATLMFIGQCHKPESPSWGTLFTQIYTSAETGLSIGILKRDLSL